MRKTVKKSQSSQKLTLHGLLGSLSYWGSATRILLVSILVMFAFVLNVTVTSAASSAFVNQEVLVLLYSIAVLFVADTAYVMVARAMPLNKKADRWMVMLTDIILASFFVIPSFFYVGEAYSTMLRVISPAIMLLVLSVRILLGLLFAKPTK